MDPRTREALEASIKHWRENVEAESPEYVKVHGDACPLCTEFYAHSDCIGCPVADKTEDYFCFGTPYYRARSAHERWTADKDVTSRNDWREAAQAELDFLISLRPEE
jgi:hypothetical protein